MASKPHSGVTPLAVLYYCVRSRILKNFLTPSPVEHGFPLSEDTRAAGWLNGLFSRHGRNDPPSEAAMKKEFENSFQRIDAHFAG